MRSLSCAVDGPCACGPEKIFKLNIFSADSFRDERRPFPPAPAPVAAERVSNWATKNTFAAHMGNRTPVQSPGDSFVGAGDPCVVGQRPIETSAATPPMVRCALQQVNDLAALNSMMPSCSEAHRCPFETRALWK